MKILVMNGPNINFLGIREKGIYGTDNYETLVNMIENKAKELGVEVEVFQSNHEGAVIDKIQEAYYTDVDGIVINPGAFTHYSYAVRDALASVASAIIMVLGLEGGSTDVQSSDIHLLLFLYAMDRL